MKLSLFEYAVLRHPTDKEEKAGEKSRLIVEPTTTLAKNADAVGMMAARAIPEEHVDALENIEVIVRPF